MTGKSTGQRFFSSSKEKEMKDTARQAVNSLNKKTLGVVLILIGIAFFVFSLFF